MEMLLDIGPRLVSARRAAGMTQLELGARVGATQQQIARWESRAYANVDLQRVSRVAGELGLTPSASTGEAMVAAESAPAYGSTAVAAPTETGSRLTFSPAELRDVCGRRAVRRLALFGSVLRDDFGPASDIDVLVEFDDERFEQAEVHRLPDELSAVFGGRKVDLVEAEFLKPRLKDRVLAEAWDVFTA